jgi:hypothetical protein
MRLLVSRVLTLANANRTGERHDLNRTGTSLPQCRRGRIRGGTGRVDVVDKRNAGGYRAVRKEGACHVPPPLVLLQPALPRSPSRPREERPNRQFPERGELIRQPLSGVMPALEPAARIAGDEHDTRGIGSRQGLADDSRRPAGEPAETTLLPGGNDRPQTIVVRQCRPRVREGEPSARTLGTTPDRPSGRCAATVAERQLDPAERGGAAFANLHAGKKAEQTALRQEQIEHVITLGQRL